MTANDYFALFGLSPSYALDRDDLTRRYRELQKAVHPDRYANAGESERLMAVSQAARINDAFQTLRDPVSRARYLLQQHGGNWQDEQTIQDKAFLFEQMELREELEGLHADRELAALEAFATRVRQLEQMQEQKLAREFADLMHLHLVQGRTEIQKLMFFRKLREETEYEINAVLDEA
ncbi:Fe-S protein assembly co-chaperone HscB [Permianibacter sp. IMCC34836]|uniref:Fe-S protein assembly co-chaperone HscB n=1 Tax=Permianibacter fluminis TaxID=2738515 RepID=UPI0015537586|nr:Fe-S protein assembly co-chaperone HscB [Permianibacter fluminis]NQD38132.1 Fe-S protein assembly co-chaperone HscB [Permianibacter fluminis]